MWESGISMWYVIGQMIKECLCLQSADFQDGLLSKPSDACSG